MPAVTDLSECTVGSAGNGLDLISAAEGRDAGRRGDECVDGEDWRDEFKIWLSVTSGGRGGLGALEEVAHRGG